MKAIVLVSIIVSSSIAVDVNLTPNPKSSMSRTICCLTANLQASGLCSGVCASRECAEICYVRCGLFNSICSQSLALLIPLLARQQQHQQQQHQQQQHQQQQRQQQQPPQPSSAVQRILVRLVVFQPVECVPTIMELLDIF